MSSLYLSYKKQLKTLLITNDSDWLNQARDEFKKYLPGEQITFVQGKVLIGVTLQSAWFNLFLVT